MKFLLTLAGAALVLAATPAGRHPVAVTGTSPALQSVGTLAFGPPGILYAADQQAATIYAIELAATKSAPGTKAIDDIDGKVASMLGTAATEITISDLAVDPRSGNSYLSVTRGKGTDAKPVLMRVDGEGTLSVVSTDALKFTSVSLPNAPDAAPAGARNNPRSNSVTDMAYQDGKLFVAGLSNEEFSSKLWSFGYPFATADRGTSVEIFHGNHGGLETRSPVYSFVPYTVGGTKTLIAAYLCTPLVKFPVASLTAGAKITGTTIAELGNQNRPIDMIVYNQNGKDYLLMANTARGVMKIPTERFATEPGITARVATGTAGIAYETITSLTGVQQLDKLDATHAVMIVKTATGLNLTTVTLP